MKKIISLILITSSLFLTSCNSGDDGSGFYLNDDGKFTIINFADTQFDSPSALGSGAALRKIIDKAIKESNLEDYITASFSDGIEAIPEEITTLILAGMGGTNIIDILKKDQLKLKNIKTIIVDAHSCIPKLRAEISKLGFIISDEKIIKEDNIYYEIIKFIRAGIATYGENDLEFGPILRQEKSATFKEKYSDRIKEIDNLLVNSELPNDRAIELKQEKQRIEGII